MNVLSYKGYHCRPEFDSGGDVFFGRLAGIRDIVTFHADSVAGLRAAFEEAVDDYLESSAKLGREPNRPYSGKVMFRVDPEVHRAAATAAELAHLSLNEWAEQVLREAARAWLPARG